MVNGLMHLSGLILPKLHYYHVKDSRPMGLASLQVLKSATTGFISNFFLLTIAIVTRINLSFQIFYVCEVRKHF